MAHHEIRNNPELKECFLLHSEPRYQAIVKEDGIGAGEVNSHPKKRTNVVQTASLPSKHVGQGASGSKASGKGSIPPGPMLMSMVRKLGI